MADPQTVTPDVDAAWAQLRRGEWEAAAAGFDAALATGPDDPEALEGRAWAAWWLDDAPTLFRTREAAFLAHRERGDALGAARAAIWAGCDHHEVRGDHAVANGWHLRARRLLQDEDPAPEHGWLAFHEGAYALELEDDTTRALAGAREAVAIGESLGISDLVFLGLALEGLARVTEGDVAAGMRLLDEAGVAATSGELVEPIAITWTLCYLIYACERVRDFDRTTQWCRRMAEASDRLGFRAGTGICRVHYGGVLVLHGAWGEAEDELHRSRRLFVEVRPAAVAESDARLGELRRRQGHEDEAEALLQGAMPHPVAAVGLAHLALDREAPAVAADLLDDLVARTPEASATQVADALWGLAVARARLGQLDLAHAAARRLEAIADDVGTHALRGMASAARGAVSLASGDAVGARRALDLATTQFDAARLPYEAAVTRGELARALGHLGRDDAAREQVREAGQRLRDLGAVATADRIAARVDVSLPAPAAIPGLTPRESEVLALLAEGLRDREIAERLVISPHTVHRHVSNILTKLGLPSRAAAAAHGARLRPLP